MDDGWAAEAPTSSTNRFEIGRNKCRLKLKFAFFGWTGEKPMQRDARTEDRMKRRVEGKNET